MWRVLKNRNVMLCGISSSLAEEEIDYEKYKELRGLFIEDPWERVKSIFSTDDHGDLHPEFSHALQLGQIGLFTGALYGGAIGCALGTEQFFLNNDAKIYQNRKAAYRAVWNNTVSSFVKGAFRRAPGFGLFFFMFSLISSCSEVYRNKPSVIDSSIAGFIVGSVSKFSYGIKGMISGGVVGGIIGTIYGSIVKGLSKVTGVDQMQLKYSQFAFMKYRKERIQRAGTSINVNDEELKRTSAHPEHVHDPLNELDK